MSIHMQSSLPSADFSDSGSSSSEEEEDPADVCWDDWVEETEQGTPCLSLFDSNKTFKTVDEVLEYDKTVFGFDLVAVVANIGLDIHRRIRLINYIRKNKPAANELSTISGTEAFFSDDQYLLPVITDDPLLLNFPEDDWSDEEDEDESKTLKALQKKLARAQQALIDYRAFVASTSAAAAAVKNDDGEEVETKERDDDSHYFESYGQNDIHHTMLTDTVRTSSYAHWILSNPALFDGAVVLDVGCGTGILSLFAARSGAKKVFAVDASATIAQRAREIVQKNNLEGVITVINGKIEDIELPEEHVDIIVSEWMGYALLYESMLDSVLVARDRFLRPETGVIGPSQCQMLLALCDASEIYKERVRFWDDVYGFDLSPMAGELFDEAIVDVVGPHTLLSEPCVVKDIHIPTVTTRQLSFTSSFSLTSTASHRNPKTITSFILYFDTFFTVSGAPLNIAVTASDTDEEKVRVKVVHEKELALAEVWPVGNKSPLQRRASNSAKKNAAMAEKQQEQVDAEAKNAGENKKPKERVTSFSTGPKSVPTHWKQTLFMLREPLVVGEGTIVEGVFHCRKSETNSRELEVELHYSVREPETEASVDVTVQMYKVR